MLASVPAHNEPSAPHSIASLALVRLVIDDDGPGLSPAEREEARAAARRDQARIGLGLSVVVELADLYGGELSLGTAPIGGLRAELVLPAA
jgi:signal transduction histidine kinase